MSQPAMENRVTELESQVKILTETINIMWDGLAKYKFFKVPQPGRIEAPADDTPAVQSTISDLKDLTKLPEYEYTALNSEDSEIRLLTIHETKNPDDPIKCSLKAASLDNRNDMKNLVPLSYTWGTLSRTETILLDGKKFMVTKNLLIALRHFRNRGGDVLDTTGYYKKHPSLAANMKKARGAPVWWIDAICINQSDLDERASQVSLMTRLYKTATVVSVWLGEAADDSDRGMDLIRRLNDDPKSLAWTKEPGKSIQRLGPGTLPQKLPDDVAEIGEIEKDRNYAAIVKLFNRDWFSRVWIRQEVALPHSIGVYCGEQECTWDELMAAASLLSFLSDRYRIENMHRLSLIPDGSLTSCFQRAESLQHLREGIRHATISPDNPYVRMTGAIFQARDSESTDPRDKLYAMLPLVNPDDTNIPVDYRRPHEEGYKAAALDLARSSLDFLSACQYSEDRQNLPSWVPDLSQKWKYWPLLVTFDLESMHDATGRDIRSQPPEVSYEQEHSILRVKGIIFDTISEVSDLFVSVNSSNAQIDALRQAWFWDFYLEKRISFRERDEPGRPKYDSRNFDHHNVGVWKWDELVPQYELDRLRSPHRSFVRSTTPYNLGLYKERQSGPALAQKPAMRVVQHYLMTDSYGSQLERSEDLGRPRALFAGRRFGRSTFGGFGLFPAAVKAGDRLCRLKGSILTYVIREIRSDHWVVIGDAWFIWDCDLEKGRDVPGVRDIALV